MNTLNYLHLDEKRVADVVTALHLLLADFQIHYTNCLLYTSDAADE